MIHATGHHKRLNRFGVSPNTGFGDEDYSKEELCAEIGAAFLCGECGISSKTIENSSAYIESWIKTLKGDSRLVVFGAAQAAKAADYILGRSREEYQSK
jgi:antirestriction protein ArdC